MLGLRRRYWRLRRRLRVASAAGGVWKPLAIAEAVVILVVAGFGGGLLLRAELAGAGAAANRVAPLAKTGSGHDGGHTAGGRTPAALVSPKGSPSPQLSAAVQAAVAEASARTAVPYAAAGCAGDQKCFSSARETDGQDAAYVELAAHGYGDVSVCYVYLGNAGGWQPLSMACGSGPGFAPAEDVSVRIHAPGTCGRLRREPGAQGAVVRCLPNGSTATVTGAPTFASGQLWWPVGAGSAAGFVAEDLVIDPSALVSPKS